MISCCGGIVQAGNDDSMPSSSSSEPEDEQEVGFCWRRAEVFMLSELNGKLQTSVNKLAIEQAAHLGNSRNVSASNRKQLHVDAGRQRERDLEESLTLYEVNTHVLQQRNGLKMPDVGGVDLSHWKCPLEGTPHALPCTVSVLGV